MNQMRSCAECYASRLITLNSNENKKFNIHQFFVWYLFYKFINIQGVIL